MWVSSWDGSTWVCTCAQPLKVHGSSWTKLRCAHLATELEEDSCEEAGQSEGSDVEDDASLHSVAERSEMSIADGD